MDCLGRKGQQESCEGVGGREGSESDARGGVNGGRKGGKEMKRWERFDGVSVTEKERGRVACRGGFWSLWGVMTCKCEL
jgi:hypothetical protein